MAYDYQKHARRTMTIGCAERLCQLAKQGKGIFRNAGKGWTVLTMKHPDHDGYIYVCTTDPTERGWWLELVGEREVSYRDFDTLYEAFTHRLHLMRMRKTILRTATRKADLLFEGKVHKEDFMEGERMLKYYRACKAQQEQTKEDKL